MKYHILSIAGAMTTPIALELIRQGHVVSGSDQEKIYPPISTLLEQAEISLNQPLPQADLYIIGSGFKSFSICKDEFDQIKLQNLPYISATKFLADKVIKPESILVAGSYGKSTVTAFLSWLFIKLDLKPSYFFGGISANNIPSLQITDSKYSILEADESINGLDTQAKFLYYSVKYLILTNTNWEHKDSYKSAEDNLNAYKKLIEKLPQDGVLVYNPNDPDINKLLPFSKAKNVPYQNFDFQTSLIGKYNQENINAALTLCQALNLDIHKIISLIPEFKGILRRLQIVNQQPLIIDDFAQSPDRVKSALKAISETYLHRPIKVFFEPHASFLSHKSSLAGFSDSFQIASEVILSKIKFVPTVSRSERTTFSDYTTEIGPKIKYLPLLEDIKKHYLQTLTPNDILVHFSSGGLDGLTIIDQISYTFR